ncbi:MAG: hypothetical protein QW666_01805 [Candidatus Woesearchaeota archaeon]
MRERTEWWFIKFVKIKDLFAKKEYWRRRDFRRTLRKFDQKALLVRAREAIQKLFSAKTDILLFSRTHKVVQTRKLALKTESLRKKSIGDGEI